MSLDARITLVTTLWCGIVGTTGCNREAGQINAAARGMAKSMIQNQEGVALDSVLKAGPVSGLGDKAIFGPGVGSLVLKGDILLDIMQPYWPNPEAQFRPLVTKMLSRL